MPNIKTNKSIDKTLVILLKNKCEKANSNSFEKWINMSIERNTLQLLIQNGILNTIISDVFENLNNILQEDKNDSKKIRTLERHLQTQEKGHLYMTTVAIDKAPNLIFFSGKMLPSVQGIFIEKQIHHNKLTILVFQVHQENNNKKGSYFSLSSLKKL